MNGCDSTVTINLTINPIFNTPSNATTCSNVPYILPWGGTGVAGPNSHIYSSVKGCDSTVTINLTINPVYTSPINATTCSNLPYNLPWGGTGVAGLNSHLYSSVNGCDSTVNINLTIVSNYSTAVSASTCSNVSYNLPWGGTGVAGPNSHLYTSITGCDSTVTINLTINPTYTTPVTASTCSNIPFNLPWGGIGVAGPNSHLYSSVNGCDSTVTINLTINPIFSTSTSATTCSNVPYILPWGGTGVAGPNSHIYSSVKGCDSTVTITLTINPVYTTPINATTCSNLPYNLPWGGTGVAGLNSHLYSSVNGCDSTVNINLTIVSNYSTAVSASTCSNVPYNLLWGGTGVAGPNSHLYTSITGCDSTVTINLTINPTYTTPVTASTCSNIPFNLPWGGTGVAGPNSHLYSSVNGCDSTVTINLTINPIFSTPSNATSCSNVPYNLPWGGIGVAGANSHLYSSVNGCDSTATINLTINPVYTSPINATTCSNLPYNLPWGGTGVAGLNSHLYSSVNGCDSTVNINLTIVSNYSTAVSASTCSNVSYNLPWGGTGVAGPNSHLYSSLSGCDSTVTINLLVNPIFSTPINETTCSNVPYILPWGGTGVSGLNSHLYSSVNGCDSTVAINLTINPVYTTPVSISACNNVPYNFPWGGSTTISGLHSHTYMTANGCDSTVNLTLTLNPVLTINDTVQICNGSSYNFPWGGSANTSGIYSHTYSTVSGCDSTININLIVPPAVDVHVTHGTILCYGGSTSVTVSATGGTGIYSSGTGIINGVVAGNYVYSVMDDHGCSDTASVTLTEPSVLSLSTTTDSSSCNGGSDGTATVTVIGGTTPYTYSWSPNGGSNRMATNLISGNYIIHVVDSNGCSKSSSAFISEPTLVNISVTGNTTICIGQTTPVSVHASGGTRPYFYLWSNSNTDSLQSVAPVNTTVYSVDVQDANGCSPARQSVTVSVNPPLSVIATGSGPICKGSTVTISALASGGNGGPYLYTWNNGLIVGRNVLIAPSGNSTYIVRATDGCGTPAAIDSVMIHVNPVPIVSFLPARIQGCAPVQADFFNHSVTPAGSSFTWQLGDNTMSNDANVSHLYTVPGHYDVSLIVRTPQGCIADATILNAVNVFELPHADFTQSTDVASILRSTVVFTDNSADAISWAWDFGDGSLTSNDQNPVHTFADTGSYKIRLIVSSLGGCIDTTFGSLRVEDDFVIYIPNTFTPNGDHVNDYFTALGSGFTDYDMVIIDRWGKQIFHSTGIDHPWNGTFFGNSNPCQSDVYEYIVRVRDNTGKDHQYIGRVTLTR